MMKAFASFSSPPFLGNGPRHCRPSSVDYFRQNKGIHLDLFHNTLLGSIKTNLNGFLGSACLTTTSLILGMILTMMAYIGANLDDGATVGIRDAEHEEEGIKAPVCYLKKLIWICFLNLGCIFLICCMFWLRVVLFFLQIQEKWVAFFDNDYCLLSETDIYLSFCKFCLGFHRI